MSIYSLETHGDISGCIAGGWSPEKHEQHSDGSSATDVEYDERSVELPTKNAGIVEALYGINIEPRSMHECIDGDKCFGACDGHYPYEQEEDEVKLSVRSVVKDLAQLALF